MCSLSSLQELTLVFLLIRWEMALLHQNVLSWVLLYRLSGSLRLWREQFCGNNLWFYPLPVQMFFSRCFPNNSPHRPHGGQILDVFVTCPLAIWKQQWHVGVLGFCSYMPRMSRQWMCLPQPKMPSFFFRCVRKRNCSQKGTSWKQAWENC